MSNASGSQRKLAIIGCGPSGLLATKYALESKQLIPTTFEKSSQIGGIWNPNTGYCWNNLNTNLSKYCSMFSDFNFQHSSNIFPTQSEMYQYLQDYCNHFKLRSYTKFNCNVFKIDKVSIDNIDQTTKWKISWSDVSSKSSMIKSDIFDYLIIASGFFSNHLNQIQYFQIATNLN